MHRDIMAQESRLTASRTKIFGHGNESTWEVNNIKDSNIQNAAAPSDSMLSNQPLSNNSLRLEQRG